MPENKRYKRKRNSKKKYQPKQNNYSGRGRNNKVELLRPISLKEKSIMKKVIFYNTAEVVNTLIGNTQNAQFSSFYLNSPWLQASNLYAHQGTNQWNWNNAIYLVNHSLHKIAH